MLCDFLSTSFRKGTVIDASLATGESRAQPVRNTFRDARLIGLSIASRKDVYTDAMCEAFGSCVEAAIRCNEYEEVSARFDPGLIIDFPYINISTVKWELSTRSCLTVCAGGLKSKIWTRIVREVRQSDQALKACEVVELNEVSKKCATVANMAIIRLYEQDFSSTLKTHIILNEYGTIEIFAVDCVGEEISSAIRGSFSDLSWNDNTHSIENKELAKTLRQITSFSMPKFAHDANTSPEFALQKKADFVPFRSSRGAESVFVAAADGAKAYISGLVDAGSDMKSAKYDRETHLPLSSGATAELASNIGAGY